MKPTKITPDLFRSFLDGGTSREDVPMHLLADLEFMARRVVRQQNRREKREAKHAEYHKAGLNGARAVERRRRQMEGR